MSGIDKDKLRVQLRDSLNLAVGVVARQLTGSSDLGMTENAGVENNTPAISPAPLPSPAATAISPNMQTDTRAEYVKHLTPCICFLPQFRSQDNPPTHKFVVFSELDDLANVKPSFAKCNNCGIIHRVTEVGTSHTIGKEDSRALEVIDDIKPDLPDWLVGLLEKYECEIHVWQEARFILKHFLFGRSVNLVKERQGDATTIGKACVILGRNSHKIENFEINDETA